jgi:hypothetical protein
MLLLAPWVLSGEQGVLVVHIKDVHDHPIENVRLRAGDTSISAPTNSRGRQHSATAVDRTATDTRRGANPAGNADEAGRCSVLEIVGYPKDKDLVFISPWDKWTHVPPFSNEAVNFVPVTLAERGDRECLENSDCIRAAAAQINKENAPKSAGEHTSEEQSKEALSAVAKQFGLTPKEIDQAIRNWGERTEDPYDNSLAALYGRRYPEASLELEKSFSTRKKAETDESRKSYPRNSDP